MNRNSSNIWLPAIEAAGLPTPKTIVIPYDHGALTPIFNGEDVPEMHELLGQVNAAVDQIGFPAFIRTDLASAKHSGPTAYKITCIGDIQRAVFETLEDNEMKFWVGPSPTAFLVRQFLNLEHHFTAFRGLPISREWRYFATAERVICTHPYWPMESLEGHVDEAAYPDWQFWLQQLHEPPSDRKELERMAVVAAGACGDGAWSVDFCRDVDGKWWLLDMATMQDSYHWPECPEKGK